ncbi:hypothetical protein QBK99_11205 [Corticibacterium sp. UT-5YL-CI-8]|nr:hypothetical protein [Tianweitania sp. UT-5YL-CI-8]
MNAVQQFAKECGYPGNSPAMLAAFAAIKQSGIREARLAHHERKRLVEQFKAEPTLFWGYTNLFRGLPLLSTDEAIQFFSGVQAAQQKLRREGHWRFDPAKLNMASERIIVSRYFRRFGSRVWSRSREAA